MTALRHKSATQLADRAYTIMLYALLWIVLTAATPAAIPYGAAVIVLAYRLRIRMPRPIMRPHISLWAFCRFVPIFIYYSIVGSIDIARRAVAPSRPINPALVSYASVLPPASSAFAFFMGTVSLLPGSICVVPNTDTLLLHVIDKERPAIHHLEKIELLVTQIFRLNSQTVHTEPRGLKHPI